MLDAGELVKEFLVESYENLDQLDRDFIALEIDPTATEKLASIFRTIHTIKGTCGCLGFTKLESVAHVGENLLSRLRDGVMMIDGEITTGLLKLVDSIREILREIETTGTEGTVQYDDVCQMLVRLNQRGGSPKGTTPPAPAPAPKPEVVAAAVISPASAEPLLSLDEATALLAQLDGTAPPAPAVHAEEHKDEHKADEQKAVVADPEKRAVSTESVAGNAIRVDVDLLDKLMTLVGELVLARNQVLQHTASQQDPALIRTAQRLNLITSELQEGVMKTRMQPIGNLFNKFPRIVRDVAGLCFKKIRLEMDGRDTELDKTIIEAIKDPLTHVVRNSIDHGVETPEKRTAAGKPEEGLLTMRAFHEGGQVNIEIIDDGKGIDPTVIKRKAVEKGLITADQAARMSEREAVNLVFAPGFSTAEKVTNVSGRGVGMDVVKTNIEKIGGTVEIISRVGFGTTLRIKIPLTLAIIPALIVTSGGERFAIPQVSLLELVHAEASDGNIEQINGTPLYRLRGNLLPLVYLNRELSIGSGDAGASANIVVLRSGERQFGLVVDQINDTEEIVVKPLSTQLKGLNVFAGATIMGDGRVALILDITGVAQKANVTGEHTKAAAGMADASADAAPSDSQQLLLFNMGHNRPMAIPLSVVARLEEFPRSSLEVAGDRSVVQYRGQIMPLVNVAEALGDHRSAARARRVRKDKVETDKVQVVVYAHKGKQVGLRVEQILDIVDQRVVLQEQGVRHGVIGSAIIKDKVMELIDMAALAEAAFEPRARQTSRPAPMEAA